LNVKFDFDELPGQVRKLVTSRDLQPVALVDDIRMDDVQPVHFSSASERENAQDEGILIVKLARGQELHVTAVAVLGVGKEHAKWSPVSACAFMFEPIFTPNVAALDALDDDERALIRDSCPVGAFGVTARNADASGGGSVDPGQALSVVHPHRCMFCGECEKACEDIAGGSVDHDLLSVKRDMSKFIFTVETTGALAPEDVVQQALHVIRKKMLSLQEEVQEKIDEEQQRLEVRKCVLSCRNHLTLTSLRLNSTRAITTPIFNHLGKLWGV
jgi:DNA-directed RNA polymerase II subunit RPB3